jgi:transcriptional regulator with XRE-family HTH domain
MLANVQNTQQASRNTQVPAASSQSEAQTAHVSSVIARDISSRMRRRRKELHLSQSTLARQSGVSLGSLKRFEQDSLISLESLIKLSVVLGCEESFKGLFSQSSATETPTLEDFVAQGHELLNRISDFAR